MMMIVEKPSIDIALAQGLLDGGKVHIQAVILHDPYGLPDFNYVTLSYGKKYCNANAGLWQS